ncbi:hypothetical protein O6H91_09G039200 [Diphasiastrum complanatum]|uniref:Uncharacterized protein n=1 Tax=Diphasiastrum complanatum TaxID=34168 RepID=A0ACC2CNE2_DIPCM|nr:hypothetical protein O6H91_09G039200 [Diphasiastrum complanatum]
MFYSQFILAKKGPLGTIWIAAHLERKLRKNQINETDISLSVDSILFPEVPIALRLSGHLLLGVVRIYARKVHYLYQDCSEALVKIKHAFHSGAVDLPPEAARAPFHAITLPETVEFDDALVIPYQEGFHGDLDLHVSERDQITLHDPLEETFFLAPHVEVDEQFEDDDFAIHKRDKDLLLTMPQREQITPMQTLEEDVLPPMAVDMELDENPDGKLEVAFPDWMDQDEHHVASLTPRAIDQTVTHVSTSANLEQEQLNVSEAEKLEAVGQALVVEKDISADDIPEVEKLRSAVEPTVDEPDGSALLHEPWIGDKSLKPTGINNGALLMEDVEIPEHNKEQAHEESYVFKDGSLSPFSGVAAPPTSDVIAVPDDDDVLASILGGTPFIKVAATPIETPLPSRESGNKRKRKQHFDTQTVIPSETMKRQNEDTDDLRRVRRKASSILFEKWKAEKEYHIKEIFAKASVFGLSPELLELYNHVTPLKEADYFSAADVPLSSPNSEPCTPQAGVDATGIVDHSAEIADVNKICGQNNVPGEARSGLQPDVNEMEPECYPTVTMDMDVELNQKEMHEINLELTTHDLQQADSTEFAVSVGSGEVTVAHHAQESDGQLDADIATAETMLPTIAGQGEQLTKEAQTIEILQNMDSREDIGAAAVMLPSEESSEPGLNLLADSTLEDDASSDDMYGSEGSRNLKSNIMGQDYDRWSGRTRAVAQFLQEAFKARKGGVRRSMEQQSNTLSLDKVLNKKTKKQAARMFFETLVLKSQDYIEVEQDDAYGDMILSARPKLLKATF